MLVGICIKDLFIGTPEQFNDTFGATFADDAHPMDILDAIRKYPPVAAENLPMVVYGFRDEEARQAWFAPGGGADEIKWDEVVKMTGVLTSPVIAAKLREIPLDSPNLHEIPPSASKLRSDLLDLIEKNVKPLVWRFNNRGTWEAEGIGDQNYAIFVTEDGRFFRVGHDDKHPTLKEAKDAVFEDHRKEVVRSFFDFQQRGDHHAL